MSLGLINSESSARRWWQQQGAAPPPRLEAPSPKHQLWAATRSHAVPPPASTRECTEPSLRQGAHEPGGSPARLSPTPASLRQRAKRPLSGGMPKLGGSPMQPLPPRPPPGEPAAATGQSLVSSPARTVAQDVQPAGAFVVRATPARNHCAVGNSAAYLVAILAVLLVAAVPAATASSVTPEGHLNVYGPPSRSLVPEVAIPDDTLALFQRACFNPTIPGFEHVTPEDRASAAAALGIYVPRWRNGTQVPYFPLNPVPNTNKHHSYWPACHAAKVARVAQEAGLPQDQQWRFIMYGDSLTEVWTGNRSCRAVRDRASHEAVLRRYFGPLTKTSGMSGENSANTLWRLEHGELVSGSQCPRLFQVYTGTNDFGAVHVDAGFNCCPAYASLAANRAIAITELLLQSCPEAEVIIRGLGPREAFQSYWPNRFTVAIQDFNARIKAYAESRPQLHYLVCGISVGGDGYLRQTRPDELSAECRANPECARGAVQQLRIDRQMLVDGIHPSKAGLIAEARCMWPLVSSILGFNGTADDPHPEISIARPLLSDGKRPASLGFNGNADDPHPEVSTARPLLSARKRRASLVGLLPHSFALKFALKGLYNLAHNYVP